MYLSIYVDLWVYVFIHLDYRVNMQLELRSYANPCIAGLVILDDEDRVHCMATHKLYGWMLGWGIASGPCRSGDW